MKKVISILLVAVVMLATMAVPAFAVDTVSGTCGENLTWTFDYDTGELVVSGSGEMWDYEWPESPWISYSKFIESVEISKDVTNIGNFAFVGCYNLRNVEIPDGVTNIGIGAFCDCNGLLSVTIPGSVTTIKTEAFEGYRQSLDVYYCGTQKQWELISIEEYSGLDNATIHFAQVEGECGEDVNWLFDTTTGELLISGTGKMANYSVTSPAPWDEYKSQIKELIVAEGVTTIGNDTFIGCENLEEATLPETLTAIGKCAFMDCPSIAYVAFKGTADRWSAVTVGENNEPLTSALIRFGSTAVLGDINGDTKVNSADALYCLQHSTQSIELMDEAFAMGDVDDNGKINSFDALLILEHSVGEIETF